MKSPRILTLAALLALAAPTALAGCGGADPSPGADTGRPGAQQTATNTFEVKDDVSVVDIDSAGGAITVKVGAAATIKVTEVSTFKADKPGRKQSVDGGELTLASTGCASGDCSIAYTVEIPSTLSVRLDSAGGAITLSGLTGIIDVSTDGGALKGDGLAPPELTARTGGGAVEVAVTQAPDRVDVDSGGGDVTLKLTADGYALDVELDGGKQSGTVKSEAASLHKVHVVTGGGNLAFGR
ncbi:hypothetical protein Daura_41720 [Dactylosporangium aurantiacum]|uniref:Adhesin domain-containing protein n=1 Tax=Dactylosporangium aurantiacum TaxID=35754 RepID=A0A9Q9MHV7_9ACTN|nr:hypothetical protein [Dactylosporangium aurantiacum]MDG6102701.1 hypothetical protein [Dactylosporangium aurantiacum]UWZ53051.1 hypothetical protein Daura_41720 [Dactylosporangium aurantiacum]